MATSAVVVWLVPSMLALFMYGIAQGLVKKYSGDVPPARFCLFFIVARSLVFLGWFFTNDHAPPFAEEGRTFLYFGVGAYVLDGLGWILYYKSVVLGPISIVGTLSAAYAAPTVLFARIFLDEMLSGMQYVAVGLIIAGCAGLGYEPAGAPAGKPGSRSWIPLAAGALLLWGAAQTLTKKSYEYPGASDVNLVLFATFGGALTLGVYGLMYGLNRTPGETGSGAQQLTRSFLPMAIMAGGDLAVIIALLKGQASIVTPLTAAYPLVTIPFAAFLLRERITRVQLGFMSCVLVGMVFSQAEVANWLHDKLFGA